MIAIGITFFVGFMVGLGVCLWYEIFQKILDKYLP